MVCDEKSTMKLKDAFLGEGEIQEIPIDKEIKRMLKYPENYKTYTNQEKYLHTIIFTAFGLYYARISECHS